MGDLFVGGKALWILPLSLLVFGAAFGLIPGLLLRLIVLLYPKDDPRRQELFGELYAPEKGRFERYVWVFQQLETALRDGLNARRDARRKRKEVRNLRYQLETQHVGADEVVPTLVLIELKPFNRSRHPLHDVGVDVLAQTNTLTQGIDLTHYDVFFRIERPREDEP